MDSGDAQSATSTDSRRPTSINAGLLLLGSSVALTVVPILVDPSRLLAGVDPADIGLPSELRVPYWVALTTGAIITAISALLLRAVFRRSNWARYVLVYLLIPGLPYSREAFTLLAEYPLDALSLVAYVAGLGCLFTRSATRWLNPPFRSIASLGVGE